MAGRLEVEGGGPLAGKVTVSGAKNATLPCLFASLLSGGEVRLSNVPGVADVRTAAMVLEGLGKKVARDGTDLTVEPVDDEAVEVPGELAVAMRASILCLGPLLATRGEAVVPLPGGCDFGDRPIDMHVAGMERMGAAIDVVDGKLRARARRLSGATIDLGYPTFTGTENLLMAATLAEGTTVINNAAKEPEVSNLAELLNSMGAAVSGHGTDTITVEGVASLGAAEHEVMPDRIEAGTYLAATAAAGGEVTLERSDHRVLAALLDRLHEAGAKIEAGDGSMSVAMEGRPRAVDVATAPYPGFPTDLQAQMLALNSVAEGGATVTENVWKTRFRTIDELVKLGADIRVDGSDALVTGKRRLVAAQVRASDLRASAALVIAGLCADGVTIIEGRHHLERGYEDLPGKLAGLGAKVRTS